MLLKKWWKTPVRFGEGGCFIVKTLACTTVSKKNLTHVCVDGCGHKWDPSIWNPCRSFIIIEWIFANTSTKVTLRHRLHGLWIGFVFTAKQVGDYHSVIGEGKPFLLSRGKVVTLQREAQYVACRQSPFEMSSKLNHYLSCSFNKVPAIHF